MRERGKRRRKLAELDESGIRARPYAQVEPLFISQIGWGAEWVPNGARFVNPPPLRSGEPGYDPVVTRLLNR
jgi:hypothetical protein